MKERPKIGDMIKFFRGEKEDIDYMLGKALVCSTSKTAVAATITEFLQQGPQAYLSVGDTTLIIHREIVEVIKN